MNNLKRVVVTGSRGQLGGEICRQLGDLAVGLDRPGFDLRLRDQVADRLRSLKPSAVINCAAFTQVDRAEHEADACFAVNATGVGNLASICESLDVPLLQVSTDYVFGTDKQRRTPYAEDDAPGPQGVYARSKLEGEQLAAQWRKHFVVRTCGLYVASPDGPVRGRNFVDTMLVLSRERDALRIVDDQFCTPSYVPHVVRAMLFLLSTTAYGTYHVVNSGHATWREFAAELFRLADRQVRIEAITTQAYNAPAPRPLYSVLSTTKYHALSGRPELPTWQAGLAEYYRAQPVGSATATPPGGMPSPMLIE